MITLEQQALVVRQAVLAFPNECCGFIVHHASRLIIPCPNESHDSRTNFLINPRTIERITNEFGIAGVYHSHVNWMALPSKNDLEQCTWYDVPYLIASAWSGGKTELRAYLLTYTHGRKHFRSAPEVLECL